MNKSRLPKTLELPLAKLQSFIINLLLVIIIHVHCADSMCLYMYVVLSILIACKPFPLFTISVVSSHEEANRYRQYMSEQ